MVHTKNTNRRPVGQITGANRGIQHKIRRSQEDLCEALGEQEFERLLSISRMNGQPL
jgi:hypothetical protein